MSTKLALRLRSEALERHWEYDLSSPSVRATLELQINDAAREAHVVRVLPERAVLMVRRTHSPMMAEVERGCVDVARDDPEAARWVARQLAELGPSLDPTFEMMLDGGHAAVLPMLADTLVARMTSLVGAPVQALRGLRSGSLELATPSVQIEPMKTRHLDAVMALLEGIFRERPELGILPPAVTIDDATQQQINAFVLGNLERSIAHAGAWVAVQDDAVVGQAAVVTRQDPLVGRVGGLSIALAERHRGQGLGKQLYLRMLEHMVADDVRVMRGRTANPAVEHLACRMGHEVRGYQIEKRTTRTAKDC